MKQIETDFGNIGIMLNRFNPTTALLAAEMSVIAPVFQPVPGKGKLFLNRSRRRAPAITSKFSDRPDWITAPRSCTNDYRPGGRFLRGPFLRLRCVLEQRKAKIANASGLSPELRQLLLDIVDSLTATSQPCDNSDSGQTATTVQDVIHELAAP